MPEQTIWKGSSSNWKNFSSYLLFILSIPLSIGLNFWLKDHVGWWSFLPIAITGLVAFWAWLVNVTTSYELSDERLITHHGILTKVTDTLELYRVRDLQVVQPILQ